ncbi:unnamed protein product [Effrenium voratum]|nr:unnamed protein product [Effrenium voratum]
MAFGLLTKYNNTLPKIRQAAQVAIENWLESRDGEMCQYLLEKMQRLAWDFGVWMSQDHDYMESWEDVDPAEMPDNSQILTEIQREAGHSELVQMAQREQMRAIWRLARMAELNLTPGWDATDSDSSVTYTAPTSSGQSRLAAGPEEGDVDEVGWIPDGPKSGAFQRSCNRALSFLYHDPTCLCGQGPVSQDSCPSGLRCEWCQKAGHASDFMGCRTCDWDVCTLCLPRAPRQPQSLQMIEQEIAFISRGDLHLTHANSAGAEVGSAIAQRVECMQWSSGFQLRSLDALLMGYVFSPLERGRSGSWYLMGELEAEQGNWQAAEECFLTSLEVHEATHGEAADDFAMKLFCKIGKMQEQQGDLQAAVDSFHQMLGMARTLGVHAGVPLWNLGSLKWRQGDLRMAEVFFYQQWETACALEEGLDIAADSAVCLGSIKQRQGDLRAARAWFHKSLSTFSIAGHAPHQGVAQVMKWLGDIAERQGALKTATYWYSQSLGMNEALGKSEEVSSCLLQLGVVKMAQKDLHQAGEFLSKSLQVTRSIFGQAPSVLEMRCLRQLAFLKERQLDLLESAKLNLQSLQIEQALLSASDYSLQQQASLYYRLYLSRVLVAAGPHRCLVSMALGLSVAVWQLRRLTRTT